MLSEQKHLPRLRRSISFAGSTKHTRSTKRLRNRRFNIPNRKATSLVRDNPHSRYHPYKTQKENLPVLQTEPKKSLFKSHGRFLRKFTTGDMEIFNADMSLKERMLPVLEIADKLQYSLNIENRNSENDGKASANPLKDRLLRRHNSENMGNSRSEDEPASQLKLDINGHQTYSLQSTSAESDEDVGISMPCLGDEFLNALGNSTEKTTVLSSITSEKSMVQQEDSQSCGEQTEHRSLNLGVYIDSDLKDQLSKLETTQMFDCEQDVDQDFSLAIILVTDSPTFTEPPVQTAEDTLLEQLKCSGHTADPDLRDLLCVESPVQKPEADQSSTPNDYRQALTFQDEFTCVFCGTNLEIIPFDNFPTSPKDLFDFCYDADDFQSCLASPYYSHCNDLTDMFCPLCCENRLVQN